MHELRFDRLATQGTPPFPFDRDTIVVSSGGRALSNAMGGVTPRSASGEKGRCAFYGPTQLAHQR
jgi:hypothetical protein